MKISGIYKITNTITNDFYIGSSKNVKSRWAHHKCKSRWKKHPNNPMYLDFQKYGLENFVFEILAEVEIDKLKETEQNFIEQYKPNYNQMNAKGLNVERYKEHKKEYMKEYKKEYNNQLCCYNGETLTLNALSIRFWRQDLSNPTQEAKKYLIKR